MRLPYLTPIPALCPRAEKSLDEGPGDCFTDARPPEGAEWKELFLRGWSGNESFWVEMIGVQENGWVTVSFSQANADHPTLRDQESFPLDVFKHLAVKMFYLLAAKRLENHTFREGIGIGLRNSGI